MRDIKPGLSHDVAGMWKPLVSKQKSIPLMIGWVYQTSKGTPGMLMELENDTAKLKTNTGKVIKVLKKSLKKVGS